MDFHVPEDEHICMFVERCLETVRSASTIKNYISALISCYRQMGLNPAPFEQYRVKNAALSVDKNVRHVPAPALPVYPALLKRIIRVVGRMDNGATLCAAFVIMFHTFYRQSNFAAPTSTTFDPARQLTRGDIIVHRDSLSVVHKWAKNHQAGSHRAITAIPAIPGSDLCPKAAFINMSRLVPTRSPQDPLLMFNDRSPIPLSYIRKVWGAVIRVLRIPEGHRYTLHGLRRGAASHVFNLDPTSRDHIKEHGLWASDTVDAYLPKPSSKVFDLMKETL